MKQYFIILFFLILSYSIYSQEYTVFYYSDSVKSSEGYIKDGKPDGYWKTYYSTGTLKSIGKRTDFELDSIWNFYTEQGLLSEQISYFQGKKNGYYLSYYTDNEKNILKSKVLYVNDSKESNAEYYYTNGLLYQIIPYENNKKSGQGFEYSKDSVIIARLQFVADELVSRQQINRYNSENQKVGTWMEFYPNGNIKTESNYVSGKLQGMYKMYDSREQLLRVGTYSEDSLVYSSQIMHDFEEPFERIIYYNDSTLQFKGQFKDIIPVGIHRYYSPQGKIDSCILYDMYGEIRAKGIMQEDGKKVGVWTYFYSPNIISSQGMYYNDIKHGEWKFYYENGILKQQGFYTNGKPSGVWKWYYASGKLKKHEEYVAGKRNGLSEQFSEDGKRTVQGVFVDDKEHGYWEIQLGDIIQKGNFVYGEKDKTWEHIFITSGKLRFKGTYFNTKPHGKHVYYYENGIIESEELYKYGKAVKYWNYYAPDAKLLYTVYYKNGKEYKIVTQSATK
ncbi:MAG: hypothetical protein M0R02_05205 [Bacteroidales bacterium]|nr:hypothetical protein [Bacteroidales bacterium]NLK81797.1 hypothetical protein [Bacteroidales bacterium]